MILTGCCCRAGVTVSQNTITLKTWSEGLPDPNPWFELFPSYNYPMYPYTLRNNFGSNTSSVAWRELTLENEYLRCRVLPDLGGHLYSCLDKINNVEIFYANPVIRKGPVGLRGAWVALGIELNFPVGHSLVSVSPISFGSQQNPDGSAGAWVADIDRQTGMEWRVEFVLRPGSAMLEQDVWLYNRGDVRQPYYWWSNSEETEQDQNDTFIFPTHLSGTHGFTVFDTWPINQAGTDMSVIKSYSSGLGLFAYGSNETFFAAYHPATKVGTAHYAGLASMPGKKIWTWGSSGDPYVTSNLTENFPSYIETQAGVTPNQETRLWLDPQQASHFTEYWMPARELDGISRANTSGVLYLGRTTLNGQPALVVEFNANQAITGARIRILNGSSPAAPDAIVNLDPATTYRQTISAIANNVNYTFQLLDSASNVLMTHTENQYSGLTAADVTLGNQPPPYFGPSGSEQYYLASAAYYEQYQQYSLAENDYNAGLALFPASIGLRKGSGRLAFLAARYDDAATLLAQVTALTPNDDEAHFYLGLAYAALGRNNAAASEWTGIQSAADFGPAATFELACLRALSGDLATAATLFDSANTVRAGALETAVLRRQGNIAATSAKLAQWRAVSPTDLFLRYEATLLGTPDSALSSDLGAEPERVLNLADDYLRLGFFSDTLALLNQIYPTNIPANQQEPGALAPQNNALIAYYRGYCRQQLGASPNADFAAASAMALPYIFPSRTSSFAVLRAAINANSNDATAHDLLGLLYMSRRQVDNAIAEWQTARSLNKTLPTLHRNLGRAYLDIKGDVNSALPVLSEGLNYEPSNSDLQDAYNRANAAKQASTSCPFTLTSPASGSVSIGPAATNVSVSFTGPASCNWTIAGYGGWISNATSDHGQGPGMVTYAVGANTSLTSRTQTLFVAGRPFTITQAAASCSYSLTSPGISVPTSGGPVTVGVISPSDACGWAATSTQSWMPIISGASGDGGTVTISVAPNTGAARSGAATIAGLVFTINQAGRTVAPPPLLSIMKTHTGYFEPGQQNATYTITVSNASAAGPSSGMVTVAETIPAGLTLVSMLGMGWSCINNSCTRSDVLAAGASHPPITVTVNVSPNVPSQVINQVSVSGGGSATANASDPTTINNPRVAGDFDGNGVPDVIIQNDSTRQVAIYYMGGTGGSQITGFGWIRSDGIPGWTVATVADMNGDGVPDLIIQNDSTRQVAIYYMGGTGGSQITGFSWIRSDGIPGWSVKGAADFNGDGVPDVIIQDETTRQVAVYYMGGAGGSQITGFSWIRSDGIPGWSVKGAADFNGDGVPDVIIQNDTTRQVAIYYMGGVGGVSITGFGWIRSDGIPGWSIVGLADFNGDGVPDVIIQNDTARQVAVYYMGGVGGASITGFGWIRSDGIPGWHALAP